MNARARAAARAVGMAVGPRWIRCGAIAIWPGRRLVRIGDGIVVLTPVESKILMALVAADGEPVTRSDLRAATRRPGSARIGSRAIDTHICAIRRKLGDDTEYPRIIVTVPCVGYAINV
jgi:two-component system OmpR family response regulator